jgi:hypothetical protein
MRDNKVTAPLASPVLGMHRLTLIFALLAAFALAAPAAAQQIPGLLIVPPAVGAAHPDLIQWKAALVTEREELHNKVAVHNKNCSAVEEGSNNEVPCREELADLGSALKAHIESSNQYNDAVRRAIDADAAAEAARDTECKWGDQGSSAVDLRCLGLDPDKPIAIDPNVVRGQQRVFPAQIDPSTFQNANYNMGFEALMRTTFSVKDAMDAVEFFKQAQLQRPNDPLVHNGLLLAQDILKGRQKKEQEDKGRAMESLYHGLVALATGDPSTASDSVRRASQLDPGNPVIAPWNLALTEMSAVFKAPGQDIKPVEKMVGNALLSEFFGDYATEVSELKMAKSMGPENLYVDMNLDRARHISQEFPVHNAMHLAPQ